MLEQTIRDGVAARSWFHCIQLPYGIVTPGTREPDAWQLYKLPERLDEKSVLDVGAWEGGFSFEAERRGAKSVLAVDLWNRKDDPGSMGYGWDNLVFARAAIGSKVETQYQSVYMLSPDFLGVFDVVLFLEVLYHLQHPLLALQKISSVCGSFLALETWIDCVDVPYPAMAFYEGPELNGDPTNWFGPNRACVEGMLRTVGFKNIEMVYSRPDVHLGGRGMRACFHATK